MSSFINAIRKIADSRQVLKDLTNQIHRIAISQSLHQADDSSFIRRQRSDTDRVNFSTANNMFEASVSRVTSKFYLPMEPDGQILKLWLRFNYPKSKEDDLSGFGNVSTLVGQPVFVASQPGFDLAMSLDGQGSFVQITDNPNIQNNSLQTTGPTRNMISFSIWIYPTDLSLSGANSDIPRVIFSKTDSANYGSILALDPSGAVRFTMKDQGTTITRRSNANVATVNNWHHIVTSYDPTIAGNPILYVDNIAYTNTDSTPLLLNDYHLITDMLLGATDTTLASSKIDGEGCFSGLIDEFRLYKTGLTATQISSLYTNLYTISPIPAGQVAIIGKWYFIKQPSFTSLSFSPKSFTITDTIVLQPNLYDDFIQTNYTITAGQNSPNAKWNCIAVGGTGTTGVNNQLFKMQTQSPITSTSETYLAKVQQVSSVSYTKHTIQLLAMTNTQLRSGSGGNPNSNEVGAILFRYTDATHYYYFLQGKSGCELGKFDGSATKQVLASEALTGLTLGVWNTWTITITGKQITILVNNAVIFDYNDTTQSSALQSGRVVMQSEDAEAYFDNIYVKILP